MATTTAVPKTRIAGGSFLLESRRPDEVFTPEDFTEQQRLIGQTAEEFTVNEILPNVEKMEQEKNMATAEVIGMPTNAVSVPPPQSCMIAAEDLWKTYDVAFLNQMLDQL